MAQGVKLTEAQIERIRATWLLTRNGSHAARVAGCHVTTANRYIRDHREELAQLAQEKRPELTDVLRSVLEELLTASVESKKLSQAPLGQLLTGAGIVIDKMQLLKGEPTSRNETRAYDPGRLTYEERRRLEELTLKMATGGDR